MLYFDKRIRYLHYYENGVKLQSAGYVNFQVRDQRCLMNLYVRGPRLMGNGMGKIYLEYGCVFDDFPHIWKEENAKCKRVLLDEMQIWNGQGSYYARLDALHMADTGLRYDQICGICIELSQNRVLSSRWIVEHTMPERLTGKSENIILEEFTGISEDMVLEDSAGTAEDRASKSNTGKFYDNFYLGEESDVSMTEEKQGEEWEENRERDLQEKAEVTQSKNSEVAREENLRTESEKEPERTEETKETKASGTSEESEEAKTPETSEGPEVAKDSETAEKSEEMLKALDWSGDEKKNKSDWESLKEKFPVIHPLGDEEYLKLDLSDLSRLRDEKQVLEQNSFLLHGYYNYKYLILGKQEKEGKTQYYLGVPGIYHEREKAVAIMFGFEAFEGNREPIRRGDFGYYFRRVSLQNQREE
ncbi:MAG: DUF6128 domain-containing protein [Lachnospiraceae bacterium]